MTGSIVLLLQAIVYFIVMSALFRSRRRLGIGVFVCALGVMHFVETYLAAVFFIRLPFGLISPGSTVMFAGKLAMILLLYIKEDAETVRQPIYGLLIGNCLMVMLVGILRLSPPPEMVGGHNPDLKLLDQMGALMIWGTLLLYVDAIGVILLYERLRGLLGRQIWPRALVALAAVLTFDQAFFFLGLHLVAATPSTALFGGWIAKMAAAALYTGLIAGYLRWIEQKPSPARDLPVSGVFDKLTYRRRYEELLETSSIDQLTGALNRGRFEAMGRQSVAQALASEQPLSLAIIDIDHFKQINDRYGHLAGDEVLRKVAQALRQTIRGDDRIFRYGGEEFVVLCEGLNHEAGLRQAERLRAAVPAALAGELDDPPTVSIGLATLPDDGGDIGAIMRHADRNLYQAKRDGRDRVVGNRLASSRP
jgi:diguanylate cyclase (GGDEF)-like protein